MSKSFIYCVHLCVRVLSWGGWVNERMRTYMCIYVCTNNIKRLRTTRVIFERRVHKDQRLTCMY